MAKRFEIPAFPKGEVSQYTTNPFNHNVTSFGLTGRDGEIVRPNDDLLIQRGGAEAFNIYQKLLFDETVQASLGKLIQEITAREWKLTAATEKPGDIAVKDFVEEILKDLTMDEIYHNFMEAYIVGFSTCEVMWRRTSAGIRPYDVRFRDQRRFRFQEEEDADYGFTMRLATREEPYDGIELPPRKFMIMRYWSQGNGDPYGCGLGRILYPLVKFKRRALESQLLYSDRFANPTAVAKAPLSATTNEIDTLYDHLSNLSQETALVMPEGFELEFVNPGGTPEIFEKLRDSLTTDITLLIAGEDEAGSANSGSRASSEVAQNVRVARAHDMSQLISQILNKNLIRWIVDLNFGTNVLSPTIERDFEVKEDISMTMADVATLVKDVGLRPTVEWISDRFNVDLEEEEFQIPTGPEGTAGVDTMTDGGKTLDGMEDEDDMDGTTEDGDDGEESELDSTINNVLGDEDEAEEDDSQEEGEDDGGVSGLRSALKNFLG
jgi:phage gp29-like protein